MSWIWRLRARAARPGLLRKPAKSLYNKVQSLMGFYVPPNTRFVGEPYFPHGMNGVYVASQSMIGSDAVILQQVTIGSSTLIDSRRVGAPIIGDRVYIGAGAKVIGAVTIGNDVRIGANAVVTRDVPDNATVMGTNTIVPCELPRDNRHWRHTAEGWEAINGSGTVPASPEQGRRLDEAFGYGKLD